MAPMSGSALRDLQVASRLVWKRGLPASLIFFVTSKCNLACRHCFYWRELNQKRDELTLTEIEKITRSVPNLLTVSLTGGEPYLRPDLPDIAAAFERNSHVRNIQIPSNGFAVDLTLKRAGELLAKVRTARVATGVSLDGPPEIHNEIRQNAQSYDRALETLRGLKGLKQAHPNLSVGVALTLSAANQERIMDFYREIAETLAPDAITLTLVRGNPIDPELKVVDLEKYAQISEEIIRYRRAHRPINAWTDRLVIAKEHETYRLVLETASAARRVSPCYAGHLVGILNETGQVYLCETLDRTMGNVRDFGCDFSALWSSDAADAARRYQVELGCHCTYECATSVNSLFNPRRAWRILKESILA
jgi:MoaA/NifB/PqqE/SkfB family radical SAM enzyme